MHNVHFWPIHFLIPKASVVNASLIFAKKPVVADPLDATEAVYEVFESTEVPPVLAETVDASFVFFIWILQRQSRDEH